jgi:hypothetical protein
MTSGDLDAHMAQARQHANVGLPVGPSERFRLAKRLIYRVSWPFLRHQVAFNLAVMESNRDLVERITRLQERIEQGLRNELLDFADRSASQAHAEINDHVAEARSTHAELILELRALQARLSSMVTEPGRGFPAEGGPARLQGPDVAGVDGGAHESQT